MVKKIKKQVGGIVPRVGGNLAGGARPLGGVGAAGAGALPGTRMVKKGGSIKAKRGGRVSKAKGGRVKK